MHTWAKSIAFGRRWVFGPPMGHKGYTVLGWVVWQVASRVAKRKMVQNRAKLGAVGVIALVLIGGVIAAKHDADA